MTDFITLYDRKLYDAFAESLCQHIKWVQEIGQNLGVPSERLLRHDHSKWSAEEFAGYALNFHGGKEKYDPALITNAFSYAWLHHIHHNDHHWQHWLFPDGYTPANSSVENGAVEMPVYAALEMVADWMGASMAYTGDTDISDWLSKNMPKIRIHSKTAQYLRGVLDTLGYADIVYAQRFAHEQK